jgi:hypothetical protein
MIDSLEREALLSELRSAIYLPIVCATWSCPRCRKRNARGGAFCVECILWRGITQVRLPSEKLRRFVDLHRKVHKRQQMAREIEGQLMSAEPVAESELPHHDDQSVRAYG